MSSERNVLLDVVKIVMAALVVSLHGHIFGDISGKISYITVNGICRIAVPFFFIINGYFFSRVNDSGKLFKFIKRGLILYLVWELIYVILFMRLFNPSDSIVKYFISNITIGWWHLWYLLAMVEALLFVYVLRNKHLLGFIMAIVLYLIGTGIQYAINYNLFGNEYHYGDTVFIYRNGLFLGFPFCYIGYLLSRYNFKLPLSINWHIFLTFVCLGFVCIESWYNLNNMASVGPCDMLVSLILLVPILFMLIMRLDKIYLPTYLPTYLPMIATSIYLIHPFWIIVIRLINNHTNIHISSTPIVIMTFILSIISSYFIIKINKVVKIIL